MLSKEWRTSTRSGDGGNCVEVRHVDEMVEVRDTKDRGKPAHRYTLAEWRAFVAGAKDGEFDV